MTEYTDNYGLNKYSDGDAANLRDQYNASMDIIDNQVHVNATNIATAQDTANAANTTAQEAKTSAGDAMSLAQTNEEGLATTKEGLATTTEKVDSMLDPGIAVFIGDSITQGYGTTNPADRYSTVASKMLGMTEKNYSRHGAGWIQRSPDSDGLTIPQLVSQAISDSSYDHNRVKLLVLACGINDNNSNNFGNIVTQNCNLLQKSFPNAKYLMLVCPTGGDTNSTQDYLSTPGTAGTGKKFGVIGMGNVISNMNFQAKQTKFATIQAWNTFAFAGNRESFTDDLLHPNKAGHAVYANMVASAYNMTVDGYGFANFSVYNRMPNESIKQKIQQINVDASVATLPDSIGIIAQPTIVEVSDDVITIAVWANFDFTVTVNKNITGDNALYIPFVQFSSSMIRGISDYTKRNIENNPIHSFKEQSSDGANISYGVTFDVMSGTLCFVIVNAQQGKSYRIDRLVTENLITPTIRSYQYKN